MLPTTAGSRPRISVPTVAAGRRAAGVSALQLRRRWWWDTGGPGPGSGLPAPQPGHPQQLQVGGVLGTPRVPAERLQQPQLPTGACGGPGGLGLLYPAACPGDVRAAVTATTISATTRAGESGGRRHGGRAAPGRVHAAAAAVFVVFVVVVAEPEPLSQPGVAAGGLRRRQEVGGSEGG